MKDQYKNYELNVMETCMLDKEEERERERERERMENKNRSNGKTTLNIIRYYYFSSIIPISLD